MRARALDVARVATMAGVLGCGLEPRYELRPPEGVALGDDRRDSTIADPVNLGPVADARAVLEAGAPRMGSSGSGVSSAEGRDAGAQSAARMDGGACVSSVRLVPPEGAVHVPSSMPLEFLSNPPASGAHYGTGAPYRDYGDFVVPRGHWLHDVELGGIVLLYGPTADAVTIRELRAVYAELPDDPACERNRTLLTMDPELDDAIAVVAWDYVLEAACVDTEAIVQFVLGHRGQGREDRCDVDTF